MEELGPVETKFANIVWDAAPCNSRRIVDLCQQQLGWKKSTTYTVLKKFIKKGIFKNEKGIVSVIIPRTTFYVQQSGQFIQDKFKGSLPSFFSAFVRENRLTEKDITEIRKILDDISNE